jgi:hypothetical protein
MDTLHEQLVDLIAGTPKEAEILALTTKLIDEWEEFHSDTENAIKNLEVRNADLTQLKLDSDSLKDMHNRLGAESKQMIKDRIELDTRIAVHVATKEADERLIASMKLMWAQAFSCPKAQELAFNLYGNVNGMGADANGNYQNPNVNLGGTITQPTGTK